MYKKLAILIIVILAVVFFISSQKPSSAQTSSVTLGSWQSSQPLPDTDGNRRSHPFSSFSRGNYYYVLTRIKDTEDRKVFFAQQQTNGQLSNWQVAINSHGGTQGYTAINVNGDPFHFRNGHIAKFVFNNDGTINDIVLQESSMTESFGGNLYFWDTAIYAPLTNNRYVYHLGGYSDAQGHGGYRNQIYFSNVPIGNRFTDTGKTHPDERPGKAAFFHPNGADYGYIYTAAHEGNHLWKAKVNANGSLGNWEDASDLPNGTGNNRGDFIIINNTFFVIRGKKVFQSTITSINGNLSTWDDSTPDLPEEQIDQYLWGGGEKEGASFGIIDDYVYVTGPKKVYFAKINGGADTTVSPNPTATTGPTPTLAPCTVPNNSELFFRFLPDKVTDIAKFNQGGGLKIVGINKTKQCIKTVDSFPIAKTEDGTGFVPDGNIPLPEGEYTIYLSGPRNISQKFENVKFSSDPTKTPLDCSTATPSNDCGDLGLSARQPNKTLFSGDANRDNVINTIDFEYYRPSIGQTGAAQNNSDFDFNGKVEYKNGTGDDFEIFKANFGKQGV